MAGFEFKSGKLEACRPNTGIDLCVYIVLSRGQQLSWASLVAQLVKNSPAMRETWVRSLGWEDPLEKGKVTHSYPLQYSGLENSMDCISHWGCQQSDTTEQFSLSAALLLPRAPTIPLGLSLHHFTCFVTCLKILSCKFLTPDTMTPWEDSLLPSIHSNSDHFQNWGF